MSKAKKLLDTIRDIAAEEAGDVVIKDGEGMHRLDEGKWLKVSFEREIEIDRNTQLQSGDKHAHIYDRKGNSMR